LTAASTAPPSPRPDRLPIHTSTLTDRKKPRRRERGCATPIPRRTDLEAEIAIPPVQPDNSPVRPIPCVSASAPPRFNRFDRRTSAVDFHFRNNPPRQTSKHRHQSQTRHPQTARATRPHSGNAPRNRGWDWTEPAAHATRDDVEQLCAETAEGLGLAIDFRQTNGEGELVTWVQECRGRAAGIIINPAGYTTTSIALLDALLASELPVIEVHISNIHRREEFRQHSYVSKAAVGVICGLG